MLYVDSQAETDKQEILFSEKLGISADSNS
jgi:hypothetical protein